MSVQVAAAPATSNNKSASLSSSLSRDLDTVNSGKAPRSGSMLLGFGDGTGTNIDHHYHEMSTTNTTAAASTNTNSDPREKAGGNNHHNNNSNNNNHNNNNHRHPALTAAAASSMETGLIANHTLKHVGVGDPPRPAHRHIPAPPPQQFNQIQNSSSQAQAQAEPENQQHRGKDNLLRSQLAQQQQQQMLNKSEEEAEELPCKPADEMGSKYEHASLGPPNNINNQQSTNAGNSTGSECHLYYGNVRGGPRFDQHGGQQSTGMGMMHPSAHNSMDPSQNSHEGYQSSQYNHYPNYGPGYGTLSSPRQGNSMGPGSNTIAAAASHHGKATTMAATAHSNVGGFHRFAGQSQHRSGATPTLNQLLTAPSPMMRGYGTSYPDYNSPSTHLHHHHQQQQPPGLGMGRDMSAQYGSAAPGWGVQRTHPAMSPGNTMSRAQTSAMDPMVVKRTQLYGMNSNPYSQQQGGSYPGQQYISPPHRYPMGMHTGNQEGMGGMQYPQQQMPPQYSQQGLQLYYSPPQQPAALAQPAHMQQKLPPQQGVSHEGYGNRSQLSMTLGKPNHVDRSLVQQEKPSRSLVQQERPSRSLVQQERPSRSLAQQDRPSRSLVQQERPSRSLVKQERPSRSLVQQERPSRSLVQQERPSRCLVQQERPSSLPDLSGSIDDLPTGTEATLSSAVSTSGSEQSNPSQSPFSPHASPHLSNMCSGPSPSPVGSPVGSNQSRSGPISPASIPGFLPGMLRNPLMSQHATQPPGPSMSPHPLPGGQVHPGMGPMSQHATQPSGPSMSPHPSPGGQVHPGMGQMSQHATQQSGPSMSQHPLPGMGAYQQGGSSGTYGPQSGHYGPQGNYPRPPNYGGAPSANYSGAGPGMSNSLGMNASSPMHGQGPGQPCGSMPLGRGPASGMASRPYPGSMSNMTPNSPSMPQQAVQGMGPPLPSINRKAQEAAAAVMQAAASSAHSRLAYVKSPVYSSQAGSGGRGMFMQQHPNYSQAPMVHQPDQCRQSSYPSMTQSGMMGSNSCYSQPMNNNSGAMNPQGPAYNLGSSSAGLMGLAGDMMNAADPKLPLKPESKEDSIPSLESKTKVSSLQRVDSIPSLKTKVSSLQHVDSIPSLETKTKVSSLQHVDSIPSLETKTKDSPSSQGISQPPTPGSLPVPSPLSPCTASISSCHGDESDCISSPGWPKTPASPKSISSTTTNEKISKLYEMGSEPERGVWVERYLGFMEERGSAVLNLPAVGKKPLDLCRLYMAVKEIGGLAQVNKSKKWRELSSILHMGTSSSAASSLKKHYIQYLFAFECKVERGEEPPPGSFSMGHNKKQARIHPPSPANSGSLQGPHTPQSTGSSSMTEAPGDLQPPAPVSAAHGQMPPLQGNRSSAVSVQDPFSEISDPAFQKHSTPYQPGVNTPEGMMRMHFESSKGPLGGMRKVPGNSEPFMSPAQLSSSGMQDMYSRPPSGGMSSLGMGQRQQYPYGPGYDRRPDHGMGPEGSLRPPGGQSNMVPSNSDPSMYSPHRHPGQQRHDPYRQQYSGQSTPSSQLPYGSHQPALFPQQQGYKRPMEGMYCPPAKRHEGEVYSMQYGSQHPDMYSQYGSSFSGPERRPIQGQYPYPYSRDRLQIAGQPPPQQHGMLSSALQHTSNTGAGPQQNTWPSRTALPYPYTNRQGPGGSSQGPIYPGMGREDESVVPDQRLNPESQWPSHINQGQSPYLPHSSGCLPSMTSRPPQPSYQTPPSMPNHISGAPSPASFQRSLESRVSPSKSLFLPAMKMQKVGHPAPASHVSSPAVQPPVDRCEIGFPPGSAEATQPVLKPRRRITSKDTATPEAWRVMMSLKSGLLAESTWALDTINILLYDDSTVASFNLLQLPGFLELMVEYFRKCLIEIFGILKEYEIGAPGQKALLEPVSIKKENIQVEAIDCGTEENKANCKEEQAQEPDEPERSEIDKEEEAEAEEQEEKRGVDTGQETLDKPEEKPKQASKFDKLPLELVDAEDDFVVERSEQLGHVQEFSSGLLHWKIGGGDSTEHIQTHFESRVEVAMRGRHGDSCANPDKEHKKNEQVEMEEAVSEEQVENSITATIDDVLSARPGTLTEGNLFPTSTHPDQPPSHIRQAKSHRNIKLLEDEHRTRDELPLSTIASWQDSLTKRCICVSNIVRSLSFVPGNDAEMSKHSGLVLILGKMVLLHHEHPERKRAPQTYETGEVQDKGLACSKDEWWWDCLAVLREDSLVTLANIAGHLDLSLYPQSICLPILDGLLHWMVCPSAEAQDPFPLAEPSSALTPQRLALETLCKLSVQDSNVDLILATAPFSRLEKLYATLLRFVGDRKNQVYREMSVAILSNLAQGDTLASRAIAVQKGSIGNLLSFLEDGVTLAQYQQSQHNHLHMEPPSINMMCRAAKALLAMARVEENRSEFVLFEGRLLDISISSVLNSTVACIICEVLFQIGRL
ncbi:AT-rich interactive domain-containing protein 1B-like isoform X3 [Polyodon spathula]|uniref:AT-rich interactive domain-containing protein 1B-like isoform X3 n=1 Tax=Polyodon spathula TaxID=7913 RepID=UPI001B7EF5F2|nr:AT-rich interactive domain-containing protein 1B-like isoform X3 [Polyodon spathula]